LSEVVLRLLAMLYAIASRTSHLDEKMAGAVYAKHTWDVPVTTPLLDSEQMKHIRDDATVVVFMGRGGRAAP
jgi:hypothetical protein